MLIRTVRVRVHVHVRISVAPIKIISLQYQIFIFVEEVPSDQRGTAIRVGGGRGGRSLSASEETTDEVEYD